MAGGIGDLYYGCATSKSATTAVLKAKGGANAVQGVPNKVAIGFFLTLLLSQLAE